MKKIILVFTLCTVTLFAFAQDEEEPKPEKEKGFQKEKLFVGGNFGVSFGSYTFINISPLIGYRFTDHFAAGVGLNLQYVSEKLEDNGDTYYKTEQGVTGLSVFGRVYPIRQFMLQVQPEVNYIFGKEKYYLPPNPGEYNLDSEIVPSVLLGGGLVLPAGGRGALIISVFYDILQRDNSPYSNNAIVNFSYNVGF